jgi:hypothetical protein
VSVTVRLDKTVQAAIATIGDDAWQTIAYPHAVLDPDSGRWISRAEVAEIPFTAFASRKAAERVPGLLVVRRIPRPQHPSRARPTGLVRPVTVPRVFHHHRP